MKKKHSHERKPLPSSADQADQTRGAQRLRPLRRIARSLCPRGLWHSHCGNLLYKSAFSAFRDPSLRPSRYPNVQQRLLRSTAAAAILSPCRCDIPHNVIAAVSLTEVSAPRAAARSRTRLLPAAAAAGVPGLCWPARLSATASAAGSLCVRPKFSSRTLIEYRPAAALCRVVSSPHRARKMMISAWRV